MMGKKKKWLSAIKGAFRSPPKSSGASPVKVFQEFPTVTDETLSLFSQKRALLDNKPNWSGRKSHSEELSEVSSTRGSKLAFHADKIYSHVEEEQSKHALAVAVATAAAAEAAVAAAQAAAAVVRLNSGAARHSFRSSNAREEILNEEWAAVRIQTAFRAYLARRALRALKGLVRLQALVRGHTIRRQSTITLKCMQALTRVQARVRQRRLKPTEDSQVMQQELWERRLKKLQTIKSAEDSIESKMREDDTPTADVSKAKRNSKQQTATKRERYPAATQSHQIQQKTSDLKNNFVISSTNAEYEPYEPDNLHWGWSWLEQWMAAVPWEDRALHNHLPEDVQVVKSTENDSPKSLTPPRLNTIRKSPARRHHSGPLPTKPISHSRPAVKNSITKPTPIIATQGTSPLTVRIPRVNSPRTPPRSAAAPLPVRVHTASPRSTRVSEGCRSPASMQRGSPLSTAASTKFGYRSTTRRSAKPSDAESMGSPREKPNYMSPTKAAKAKVKAYSNSWRGAASPERDPAVSSANRRISNPSPTASPLRSAKPRQLPSPRAPKGVFAPVKSARSVLSLQEISSGGTSSNGDTRSFR
ncbi:hypothetical protein O6H91_18G029200 [Diphasiastrum complanatum]|uniref:Uncharacterized protein n=1 Tax=Diphasiastrum complanatum TaxID=34168 RepID=A0ACC2B0H5_DIPCM|nr:hypothetical protein O6H91_Y018200 [Diphasiastrum complanatum]KAJ7522849.1 hypothetical protein O6H91_18G029200 [Diphasiastrum complanatum]